MDSKPKMDKKKVDTKEFEIPETVFIRDIEDKVFQSIVLQCLAQIEGISLVEGNFIDHLLGRSSEGSKGLVPNKMIKIEKWISRLKSISFLERASLRKRKRFRQK